MTDRFKRAVRERIKRTGEKYTTARAAMLLERAASHEMTPAEREEQRRSFAYGNVALSNPSVTRELVDAVADEMAEEKR